MRATLCSYSVYSEMLLPKQFRGLITASTLTVKTVLHAGFKMHLQLTVAEYSMEVHCDTPVLSLNTPPVMFNLL